jgi:hypothetical protein
MHRRLNWQRWQHSIMRTLKVRLAQELSMHALKAAANGYQRGEAWSPLWSPLRTTKMACRDR